ncbi:PEP/pyruvate-binding domain-containing protein [Bacteroidota bacterium]
MDIAVAKTLTEFETALDYIPEESFNLHALENQFSLWLMARGEIQLAKTFNPIKTSDFETFEDCKAFFIETIRYYRNEKKKGQILVFDENSILDEKNIVSFSGGSLGGKGRGLAFINTLIYNLNFSEVSDKINIRTPITAIIGTDEFESFIKRNKLIDVISNPIISYSEIKKAFINARLSDSLTEKLELFIDRIKKPIAVRSSSLSEDSFTKPFAGVFDTYIIPYECFNKKISLKRLAEAIKLVYASIYSDSARSYFKAINHKAEEEKMAVILQELVGNQYDNYYYPHISGIAQSFNYYPVAHMKPDEGFAVAAVGLGSYVVDGWKSYRFSPKYPTIEMYTTKDLLNSSQVKFYAVDCAKKDIDFIKDGELAALSLLNISEAEKHGTIKHCASVYNYENDRVEIGLSSNGPRIINFTEILKHNYIPFAETINLMLNTVKEALGSPAEIEFAIDLTPTENNLPSLTSPFPKLASV